MKPEILHFPRDKSMWADESLCGCLLKTGPL